ncbi:ThiF family adenylyltransferase [Dongia sp.]|uniref:ThiF family adenylyltransferase n=1 Tax=Dongia sp. TaxID=1977262 RepID=UPI0035B2C461
MNAAFSYEAFSGRNIGFVTADEQARLRNARVFICGVGGMGGACIATLLRAGIEQYVIADIDTFEVSNLNRQVFANLDTVGQHKAEATVTLGQRINPQAKFEVFGREWIEQLETVLARVDLVINGMDDIAAGVQLYRAAARAGLAVIDAYAAPLPSVYVTTAADPRLEDRLHYPTRGLKPSEWTETDIRQSFLQELIFVMACSSSRHHIDLSVAAEVAAGKRSRMSFAPMVITTGNLMAYEAIGQLLGRKSAAGPLGYFFNPHTTEVERPPSAPLRWLKQKLASKAIAQMIGA